MQIDLAAIFDHTSALVFVIDREHRMVFANRPFFEAVGMTPEAVLDRSLWDVFDADKYRVFKEGYDEVFRTGRPIECSRYDTEKDTHCTLTLSPLRDMVVVTVHDVTDLRKTIQELTWSNDVAHDLLRQFAAASRLTIEEHQLDALTGLASRARVEDYAEGIFRITKSKDMPLSFLIIDIDHFKTFNDRFGHQVGDQILRCVARSLSSICHDSHIVGRFGGEEFLVVLPNAAMTQAVAAAEAYRAAILGIDDFGVRVTVSVGVASTSAGDTDWKSVVLRADRALYQAKDCGRNCVRFLSDDQHRAA